MKTQNPLTGRSSGTFANAIFNTQYGRNIVKGKPVVVNQPNTVDQLFAREKMTFAGQEVKKQMQFFANVFQASKLKMPVSSYLTGYQLKNAVSGTTGALALDYTKLAPEGKAFNFAAHVAIVKSVENKVTVTWDKTAMPGLLSDTTRIYALLIADAAGDYFLPNTSPTVVDETMEFDVPGTNTAKDFTVWLACSDGGTAGTTKVDCKKALECVTG